MVTGAKWLASTKYGEEKQGYIHMNVKTSEILRTHLFSVFHYATETWTIKKMDQDRLLTFEM